jgi:hypothetical protein
LSHWGNDGSRQCSDRHGSRSHWGNDGSRQCSDRHGSRSHGRIVGNDGSVRHSRSTAGAQNGNETLKDAWRSGCRWTTDGCSSARCSSGIALGDAPRQAEGVAWIQIPMVRHLQNNKKNKDNVRKGSKIKTRSKIKTQLEATRQLTFSISSLEIYECSSSLCVVFVCRSAIKPKRGNSIVVRFRISPA